MQIASVPQGATSDPKFSSITGDRDCIRRVGLQFDCVGARLLRSFDDPDGLGQSPGRGWPKSFRSTYTGRPDATHRLPILISVIGSYFTGCKGLIIIGAHRSSARWNSPAWRDTAWLPTTCKASHYVFLVRAAFETIGFDEESCSRASQRFSDNPTNLLDSASSRTALGFRRLDPIPPETELSGFYESRYYDLLRKGGRAPELRRLMEGGDVAAKELRWLRDGIYTDIVNMLDETAPGHRFSKWAAARATSLAFRRNAALGRWD